MRASPAKYPRAWHERGYPSPASSGSSSAVTVTAVHEVWMPSPSTSWQWQLNGLPLDRTIQAEMYGIDLFDNDAATVSALHAEGRKVVCYVNVGGWEDWWSDASPFS